MIIIIIIMIIIIIIIIIITIIIIIIIINETDEVLVIPSLEGDHTTSLSKENILKSLYAKQDQFNDQAVRWTKQFWINDLLYKNKISQGTLTTFLSFKRY